MATAVVGVTVREGMVETLTELVGDLIGTASKVHLYDSLFAPDESLDEAAFAAGEVTFTGYAPASLVYGTVGMGANGQATCYAGRVVFETTANSPGASVGGVYVTVETAVGPPAVLKVVRYFPFSTPISMVSALSVLSVEVVMNQPNGNGYVIVDN